MDLYVSDKESGRWGPPMNLGPDINTEGHEIFPNVAPDGKLYFASDGMLAWAASIFSTPASRTVVFGQCRRTSVTR